MSERTKEAHQAALFCARFVEFCATLEISEPDVGTDPAAHYKALVRRVRTLVNEHGLRDGRLEIGKGENAKQGPPRALKNASDGRRPQETVKPLCYRMLGFVSAAEGGRTYWVRPAGEAAQQFVAIVDPVLNRFVQHRIAKYCLPDGTASYTLTDHLRKWEEYLRGESDGPAPSACWQNEEVGQSGPATWHSNAHDYIPRILESVATAACDVTFVGVSFSISVLVGRESFVAALRRGVRVRFLIYDFVAGDLERTAHDVGLTASGLARRCVETVNALRQLHADSVKHAWRGALDVRLFAQEPGVRWYIIDQDQGEDGLTFFYPRLGRSLDGPGILAKNSERGLAQVYARQTEQILAEATPLQSWMAAYEAWLSKPTARELLEG